MTEPTQTPQTPELPKTALASAETSQQTEAQAAKQKKRRIGIAASLAALIAVILVALGLAASQGGDDTPVAESESGVAEVGEGETSISDSPAPSEGSYVDPDGEQTAEMEPAPGQFSGFDGMTLTVGGDTAQVDPVQLTSTGMLIPPTDVARLGWYSASAVPGAEGSVGSTVITGHINYQGQGAGFAQKFTELSLGDEFTIAIDGQPQTFRVTEAPFRVAKGTEMPAVVNDSTGANRVVLITCGGQFVGGTLGYEDNIFTVAEPV